jgi:tripartite-type tricarboxylate transporter receptor subunit TctC
LRHVPYRGTPAALSDLVTGRISIYIASLAELLEQHKSGAVRVLATTGATRSALLPDIATMNESGFDFEAPGWFGIYAPAHTSNDTLDRLHKAITAAVQLPETRTRCTALGFEPTGSTAGQLKELQRQQFDRWGAIVRASGYKSQT